MKTHGTVAQAALFVQQLQWKESISGGILRAGVTVPVQRVFTVAAPAALGVTNWTRQKVLAGNDSLKIHRALFFLLGDGADR